MEGKRKANCERGESPHTVYEVDLVTGCRRGGPPGGRAYKEGKSAHAEEKLTNGGEKGLSNSLFLTWGGES